MPTLYFGHPLINKFRSDVPKGFYDPIKKHTGIDIEMPVGTPILLPIDTEVFDIIKQNEMGLCIYLKNPNLKVNVDFYSDYKEGISLIECAYSSVIKFIKWHNEFKGAIS